MTGKKVKKTGEKKKEKETEELKKQLARALADYDNLTKRVEKEKKEIIKLASISLFVRLMPVFDMLENAQAHLDDQGLDHIIGDLEEVLDKEGIVKIKTKKGDDFDEKHHEVVEIEKISGKNKKGEILKVLLDGWMIKEGPVIRPTKVRVYGEKEKKGEN